MSERQQLNQIENIVMSYQRDYDVTDPISIEKYSQKMIGKTFQEIIDEDIMSYTNMVAEESGYGKDLSTVHKGDFGTTIEKHFFHYEPNSISQADFPEAGVELKVTGYRKGNNNKLSAKERLSLGMINYCEVAEETFETSHIWNKCRLMLLVFYLYDQEIRNKYDFRIDYSRLFTPPEQDVKIIKRDFELIVEKIRAGKAHELSESDTLYLGAATKSASSQNRTVQPYSDELAKPRAFSFKNSYMTYVLNNYIVPGKATYEPIMKADATESFEDYVVHRIEAHKGQSVQELCETYKVDTDKKPKNLEALLAYRMLGIKGNKAEEFEKANIAVKTIRIEKTNRIQESMSFPTFKFKELVQEEWDDSTFGNYLRETRFLFVVYKYDEHDVLRVQGCQFWNIPYADLEVEVRSVWEKAKRVLLEGLKITIVNGKNTSNLPKASENRVSHVRPHAKDKNDTYELPDGRSYPKQCFWLNNTYIWSQLEDKFKE